MPEWSITVEIFQPNSGRNLASGNREIDSVNRSDSPAIEVTSGSVQKPNDIPIQLTDGQPQQLILVVENEELKAKQNVCKEINEINQVNIVENCVPESGLKSTNPDAFNRNPNVKVDKVKESDGRDNCKEPRKADFRNSNIAKSLPTCDISKINFKKINQSIKEISANASFQLTLESQNEEHYETSDASEVSQTDNCDTNEVGIISDEVIEEEDDELDEINGQNDSENIQSEESEHENSHEESEQHETGDENELNDTSEESELNDSNVVDPSKFLSNSESERIGRTNNAISVSKSSEQQEVSEVSEQQDTSDDIDLFDTSEANEHNDATEVSELQYTSDNNEIDEPSEANGEFVDSDDNDENRDEFEIEDIDQESEVAEISEENGVDGEDISESYHSAEPSEENELENNSSGNRTDEILDESDHTNLSEFENSSTKILKQARLKSDLDCTSEIIEVVEASATSDISEIKISTGSLESHHGCSSESNKTTESNKIYSYSIAKNIETQLESRVIEINHSDNSIIVETSELKTGNLVSIPIGKNCQDEKGNEKLPKSQFRSSKVIPILTTVQSTEIEKDTHCGKTNTENCGKNNPNNIAELKSFAATECSAAASSVTIQHDKTIVISSRTENHQNERNLTESCIQKSADCSKSCSNPDVVPNVASKTISELGGFRNLIHQENVNIDIQKSVQINSVYQSIEFSTNISEQITSTEVNITNQERHILAITGTKEIPILENSRPVIEGRNITTVPRGIETSQHFQKSQDGTRVGDLIDGITKCAVVACEVNALSEVNVLSEATNLLITNLTNAVQTEARQGSSLSAVNINISSLSGEKVLAIPSNCAKEVEAKSLIETVNKSGPLVNSKPEVDDQSNAPEISALEEVKMVLNTVNEADNIQERIFKRKFYSKNNKKKKQPPFSDPEIFKFSDYDSIGFDLDNTICRYKVGAIMRLEYRLIADYLVNRYGYDQSLLLPVDDDMDFLHKGIILDVKKGNFLKCSFDGKILRATHGTRPMTRTEIAQTYGEERVWAPIVEFISTLHDHSTTNSILRSFKDYFDLPAAIACARAVDAEDRNEGPKEEYDIWRDVHVALCNMYRREYFRSDQGGFFPEMKTTPEKYIYEASDRLKKWLKSINEHTFTFLISGSSIDYASHIAQYVLGPDWRDYFDMMICTAKKPGFFHGDKPFKLLEGVDDGEAVPTDKLTIDGTYSGGNWTDLLSMVKRESGTENPHCLYVGDHVAQDVLAPSRVGIDTVAIVEELAAEGMIGDPTLHEDTTDLMSTYWGSFFTTDGDRSVMGLDRINTLYASVSMKHARLVIPGLEAVAKHPIKHPYESFGADTSGFFPGDPVILHF